MSAPVIPETELSVNYSRAGGPGGQNVNRRETRVQLTFDVTASAVLTDEQKRRILTHPSLRHLLVGDSVIQVTADTHRTQRGNVEEAVARLHRLITVALAPRRRRVPTKTPRRAKERRLADKKKQSHAKSSRRAGRLGEPD